MPLKEVIVPYLNELQEDAAAIKVVNTVKRINSEYLGFNTDGLAAVDILGQRINLVQKKVLILGAGGSAKAIAYALLQQKALITLCNRTLAKASEFTQQFGGESLDFKQLHDRQFSFDVVINTLPVPAFQEQCAHWSLPQVSNSSQKSIAMDIVYRDTETPFITMALAAGWESITGEALFDAQAKRQLQIWFGKSPLPVGEGDFKHLLLDKRIVPLK